MRLTHGLSSSKTYRAWHAMKSRCTNPKLPVWKHYGGRGISYAVEWEAFEPFYEAMGDCPDGFSLDRIDNNASYSATNCRWASKSVQEGNKNKRTNCSSKYRGVFWNSRYNKWQAKITLDGVVTYLGRFRSEKDAGKRYNECAVSLGRPLNKIEQVM